MLRLVRARGFDLGWVLWRVGALLPAVAMTYAALTAPQMNFKDYWQVLVQVTNPDGSLHPYGLITLYVGHPVEILGILVWLDAKLFGGDNRALALLAVLLTGVIVVALGRMLPARFTATQRGALTMLFSFVMFSSSALEMFVLGVSGVHWLSGLAPSTVAVCLAHRGRAMPAVGVALLASLGHGSAFPVWMALLVIGWLRREQLWRLVVTAATGAVVIAVWLVLPQRPVTMPTDTAIGPDSFLAATLGTLSPIRDSGTAATSIAVGALVGGLLIMLVALSARDRLSLSVPGIGAGEPPHQDAGWVGLAVQMVLVGIMIGGLRVEFGPTIGITSRYAVVPALATCAVITLLVWRMPMLSGARTAAIAVCVSLVTYAGGTLRADEVRAQYDPLRLAAVAMRVRDKAELSSLSVTPVAVSRAQALHIYPFNDGFTLGCGFDLGQAVDPATVRELPGAPVQGGRTVGFVDRTPGPGDERLWTGWALVDGRRADGVLVIDGNGTVVGGGSLGEPRPDVATTTGSAEQNSGWTAVARRGTTADTVVVCADDVLYRIDVRS